jgi:hypothetical protein
MDIQPPQPGPSGFKSSRFAGVLSNTLHIGTQQEHRHQLVHGDATNTATKNMTKDVHLKIIPQTGSSTNKEKHLVGRQYVHTVANSRQLTVQTIGG